MDGSSISDNTAEYGGGIFNYSGGGIENYSGTLMMEGSTVSGNTTGGSGGGIYIYKGTTTVTDSRILRARIPIVATVEPAMHPSVCCFIGLQASVCE